MTTLVEPKWVAAALRFLPVPIFAVAVAAAFLVLSLICVLIAVVDGMPVGFWIAAGVFAALSLWLAAAVAIRSGCCRHVIISRYQHTKEKPTGPILVLLLWSYSTMLMLGLHVFDAFFADKANIDLKYRVTLGLSLASSLYLAVHGKSLIRRHFGTQGGRKIQITSHQALVVFLSTLACGLYGAWLMI